MYNLIKYEGGKINEEPLTLEEGKTLMKINNNPKRTCYLKPNY